MKKFLGLLVLITVVSFLSAVDVTFNCNMNYQITLENFDPETDNLDVPGTFNGWSDSSVLTDTDEDGIYTITISDFAVGDNIEYKFRINFDWGNAEFPGGANRTYTVVDSDNILNHWYNDEEPQVITVDVTFTLYDESATYQDINVKGSYDDWQLHQAYDDGTNGDETAGDNIWTCIVADVPNGSWEWGAIEDNGTPNGIWLIEGPNLQFSIDTEGNITGQTNYDIPVPPDELEQNVIVTFQVDMNFVGASEDGVYLAGSFNEWDSADILMQDLNEDGIYSADVLFEAGTTSFHTYKYVNGSEWESINNRNLNIDDSNPTMILDVVFFNNQDPSLYTNIDVTVTFQVDMNVIETADNVFVGGDFNGWVPDTIEMIDDNTDGIYSVEYLIPAGTFKHQNYKFINGNVWELGIGNRTFDIDDSAATQILDVVTFNNFIYDNFSIQDVNVTFTINMNSLEQPWYNNGVFIRGNVFPLADDAYENQLTEGETGIFSISLLFPAGSYKDVSFSYLRKDNDNTLWQEFPEENWRTFTIDDSGTEQNLDTVNWGELTDVEDENIHSSIFNIQLSNYPNPFNPSTTISFDIVHWNTMSTEIIIYNLKGQKIRQYSLNNNRSSIVWDGTDESNTPVSSGIYFSKLQINGKSIASKKMILLK